MFYFPLQRRRNKRHKDLKLMTRKMKRKILNKTIYDNKKNKIHELVIPYSSKRIDNSWDYKGANTKEYTHCFHVYPAMMIPQVARRLIEEFGKRSKLLFDPYCGTGTSLVEANLKGINAIGTDINELARLIAKVKTTRLNLNELKDLINKFNDYLFKHNFLDFEKIKVSIPKVSNIDYWFSKNAQIKLGIILHFISRIPDKDIADFFKVAFSETVRESSLTKLSEFKLVRDKNYIGRLEPDVFSLMNAKLNRNFNGLKEFLEEVDKQVTSKVYSFNTVNDIPKLIIKPGSIDFVLTSPPYGDSRTTVAYGQFSRFSSEWLDLERANEIDKLSMGGIRSTSIRKLNYDILDEVIRSINQIDHKRALDVFSFYNEYERSIKNISVFVKKGGFVCFVVGNRTVKGIQIPNDEITREIFEKAGFIHIETIIRNIPNKRMPLRNSPSNVSGQTSQTIRNEYIVILRKI